MDAEMGEISKWQMKTVTSDVAGAVSEKRLKQLMYCARSCFISVNG
jgi:hypothetical protein